MCLFNCYYSSSTIRFVCNPYSTSNTFSATTNVAICVFDACGGSSLVISSCSSSSSGGGNSGGSCSGDQYIRLYNEQGYEVASDDDSGCSSDCSKIQYTTPAGSGCQQYSLSQGCYSSESCSGQFAVKMSTGSGSGSGGAPYLYPNSYPSGAAARAPGAPSIRRSPVGNNPLSVLWPSVMSPGMPVARNPSSPAYPMTASGGVPSFSSSIDRYKMGMLDVTHHYGHFNLLKEYTD